MCGSQLEEDFVEMAATAAARHQYAAAAAIGHPLDRVFARFVDHVHVARFRVAERLVRQCLELVTMRSHDWRPYRRTPEMHRHLVVADLFTRVCFQPDRLPGFAWLLQRRLHEVNAADADVVDMALIVADAMLADPFDYADKHDEEDFGRLDAYEMLMDFDGNLKQAHQKWGDGAELPQPSLWRYRVPASAAAAQHERQRFAMLMCCIVVGDPLGATFGVEATLPVAVRTRFAETIRTRIMDEVSSELHHRTELVLANDVLHLDPRDFCSRSGQHHHLGAVPHAPAPARRKSVARPACGARLPGARQHAAGRLDSGARLPGDRRPSAGRHALR